MDRRGFIGAILAAGAAPAVVKASSLMPIWARAEGAAIYTASFGDEILSIDQITAEAINVLSAHIKNGFLKAGTFSTMPPGTVFNNYFFSNDKISEETLRIRRPQWTS